MRSLRLPKVSLDQEPTLREKLFFGVAAVGVFVLFLNLFWSPLADRIGLKKTERQNIAVQLDGLQKLVDASRQHLGAQAKKVQGGPQGAAADPYVQRLLERKVLDPLDEVHKVVGLLGSRKLARNVKVDDVSIGEEVQKGNYTMVPLSVRLTARYGALQPYVAALEHADFPLLVRRFTLTANPGEGNISATFEVELYIIRQAG